MVTHTTYGDKQMIARQKVLRSGRLIATNYPGQHFPGLSSFSGAANGDGANEATPCGVGDVLMDAVLCDVPCSVRSVPCVSVCMLPMEIREDRGRGGRDRGYGTGVTRDKGHHIRHTLREVTIYVTHFNILQSPSEWYVWKQ